MDVGAASRDMLRTAARRREPDRYLAALLAPRDASDGLIAVAALGGELAHIDEQVGEPALGEIRLQFLRDAIAQAAQGENTGHPIADAMGAFLRARDLPIDDVEAAIDARVARLYASEPESEADLLRRTRDIEGPLFRIAARLLGVETRNGVDGVIERAAEAYGLVRIGLELPYHLSRERAPLPKAWIEAAGERSPDWTSAMNILALKARTALTAARAGLHGCPAPLKSALLPLAVVEPYLAALQKPGRDPARDIAEIAPLTRVWRIARAHLTGRI